MRRTAANDNTPLYLPEAAIAERVFGANATANWAAVAVLWEREGLPRIDPLVGCRYWPAVRSFLDRRNGIGNAVLPATADGVENWQ